jgi:hypothetical protein
MDMTIIKKIKSFNLLINKDFKNINNHISVLQKPFTSLVHKEINLKSLNCLSTDEFVSFAYSIFKISLRSNMEHLELDVHKSEKWLSTNKVTNFDESIKSSINNLDVYEKQLINYIYFEKQLVIITEIKNIINLLNCDENIVKNSINYSKFKTFFKKNNNLKKYAICFFEKVKELRDVDEKEQWISITSDDFNFNKFKVDVENFEKIYTDINYNISELSNKIDILREQKNTYNSHLNTLKNNNSRFNIAKLEDYTLKAPIDLERIDSILKYNFEHVNFLSIYILAVKIKFLCFMKHDFEKNNKSIIQEKNNEEISKKIKKYNEKSICYNNILSLILKLPNASSDENLFNLDDSLKEISLKLNTNVLSTIGFYSIFGTITNNK